MENEQNFALKNEFEKRELKDILSDAETVNPNNIASEVMEWVISNVENFVDDNMRVFKLDLVLDSSEGMEETRKLQDLYRAIPEENEKTSKFDLEKIISCRRILDEITGKAYKIMAEDKSSLDSLFNRLIFYYEKIIPNPENKQKAFEIDLEIRDLLKKKESVKTKKAKSDIHKKILTKIDDGVKLLRFQKFDGKAAVLKFEYESFDVGVQIRDPKNKEVKRQYIIPEGFSLWIELSYGIKKRPTAIF